MRNIKRHDHRKLKRTLKIKEKNKYVGETETNIPKDNSNNNNKKRKSERRKKRKYKMRKKRLDQREIKTDEK